MNAIIGMIFAGMIAILVAIRNGILTICDGIKVFIIRLIKRESLNPRDFKKKELGTVISAIAVIVFVIVMLCII